MPWLTNIPATYGAPTTLAGNERWQVYGDRVQLTVEAAAGDGGLTLGDGEIIDFATGQAVYVRVLTANPVRIWREPRP